MSLKAIHDSIDDIPEQYQSLYTERDNKWELTGIEGVKTEADVSRVQTALEKERKDHKKVKEALNTWGDLNHEEVILQLDKIPELEAAAGGNIDEKKMDELVETRIKTRLAPVERENKTLKEKLEVASQEITGFKQKDVERTVTEQVRKAATVAKVLAPAMDDAVMLAGRVFELNEDGVARTKDNVGFAPGMTPDIWLQDMQQKRPHWWPASVGGGANGNEGGGNFSKNPWSKDHWSLTAQGQVVKQQGVEKAEQMAKAANSEIGATRPTEK